MPPKTEILRVGEWLPDLPQNENPGSNTAFNVLPLDTLSYVPVPAFQRASSSPLSSAPMGVFAAKDSTEDPAVYVGTQTDLYICTNGTKPNFQKVSGTGAPYSTPQAGGWSFDLFNGAVYASNGDDPIQSAPAANESVNFSVVDTNAPRAKVIAAIQPGFLLCGNINDVTVGVQPAGIRWSALGGASNGNWPLIGSQAAITVQSDWQAIQGNIGQLTAIAPNLITCNAALFFENAVFSMIYTGNSAIFDIQPIEKARGTRSGASVVQFGQLVYYLSHDGFYLFDGTESIPIGAGKVNQTFFGLADPNYLAQVQGCADPLNGLIYWAFAGIGNTNGIPNYVLVYNTIMRRWALITAFQGSYPMVGLSFGTALDNITSALGYSLDALPYSLDSAFLAGGNYILAAFDNSNYFGYFSGPNLPYSVDTTEAQLIPGARSRVSYVRPLVEGDTPSVAVGQRNSLATASVYGAPVAVNAQGIAPQRSEGRYSRVMLTGASGNNATHINSVEVAYSPAGKR